MLANTAGTQLTARVTRAHLTLSRCERALGRLGKITLKPDHHLLLIEFGAHRQHSVCETAHDVGDRVRIELIENADTDLNRL